MKTKSQNQMGVKLKTAYFNCSSAEILCGQINDNTNLAMDNFNFVLFNINNYHTLCKR
ncbi:MAG TPA: hypothetical protein VKD08_08645 [Ignavibacteriaceae bacterium]|nr:hypothetical protein [Ignavibacteriaceae bacterium]